MPGGSCLAFLWRLTAFYFGETLAWLAVLILCRSLGITVDTSICGGFYTRIAEYQQLRGFWCGGEGEAAGAFA